MSLAESIAPHLPYLRRFARALTGSQESGDAYVVAVLETPGFGSVQLSPEPVSAHRVSITASSKSGIPSGSIRTRRSRGEIPG